LSEPLAPECGSGEGISAIYIIPYALIENVVTHTDHRNRGFGKAILKAATERAWVEGCYKVMLMTGSKRPSTIAFYGAAGFEQTKTGFQIRR
jgi:GNAT superfamily N-acetyltransferase